MRCPRCGGSDGAHYAACLFANIFQRIVGPEYPLFNPAPDPIPLTPLGQLEVEELAHAVTEPLREQLAAMRRDLDAALDAITRPAPPPPPEPELVPLAGQVVTREELSDFLAREATEAEAAAEAAEDRPEPPQPEPPRMEGVTDWAMLVRNLREANGWSQKQLAGRIGSSRALIGFWETGRGEPGVKFRKKLLALRDHTPEPEESPPLRPRGVPQEDRLAALNDRPRDAGAATMKEALDQYAVAAPDSWISNDDLLVIGRKIDPTVTQRQIGLGMRALGYTEKRQFPDAPGSARKPNHYKGLRKKEQPIPTPAPEPSLEEQMARRRAAEAAAKAEMHPEPPTKERHRYDGPRPGGEIPAEYRSMLEPLWSIPGWSYARTNANGGGKPRVTNPGGTSFVLPNTPSDVRSIKNVRAALRRLGAPL